MKKTNKKEQYNQKDPRIVYALIGSDAFYIGQTAYPDLATIYSHKLRDPSSKTHRYFHSSEHKPGCFILHSDTMTISETYRYMIAWCRILQETFSIRCIDAALSEYASDMIGNTVRYYEQESKRIDEVLCCDRCRLKKREQLQCNCALKNKGGMDNETSSDNIPR